MLKLSQKSILLIHVAYVDDVRDRLMDIILKQKGVREVLISFDEDDGVIDMETGPIILNGPAKQFNSKLPE